MTFIRDPRSLETNPDAGGVLARRDMLLASGLAMTAVAAPSRAQSAPTSAKHGNVVDGTSAKGHGAIGDGQYHPLSNRFVTLAAARVVYPFAARLDQSLDWAGIQAAVDAVEVSGGIATVPVGRYILSDSIRVPSGVTLRGEARNGSILDNQNRQLNAPQIVNKDPTAFLYTTIRDLTLHGGTHAIRVQVTRETAGIVIEGITTNLQSEGNIVFSSMQTTVIRDCHLMDGKHGIAVEGFPCNSVHIDNTRLGRHSEASIYLRGADGFVMWGGSIEAGGTRGRATIDIETGGAYANAIQFQNVYFENTHEFLLRTRGARTIGFDGCKATGTAALGGGTTAYRFDCGSDLISFGDNHWNYPTVGPENLLMIGRNDGLAGTGTCWWERSGRSARLESRRFALDEARRGLFTVDFGDRGGRAWGELILYLEAGDDRPLRRLALPVDIVSGANGRATLAPPPAGEAQLVVATFDGDLGLTVRLGAGLTGYQWLWFGLALSANTVGAMTVDVL